MSANEAADFSDGSAWDGFTIVGRYDDSGETTVAYVPRDLLHEEPHAAALRHTALHSENGQFEVVAVLAGRCQVLVTGQTLRLYAERLLRGR